jgi:AcrR family transcriptional regulator
MRNRARVLEAAYAAFAEIGIDAQMEDIARRAGVGVGTVYRHFPTKEALLDAVSMGRIEGLLEQARAALSEPDAGAAFFGIVRQAAELQAADGFCPHNAAMASESAQAHLFYEELNDTTMRVVRRAQKQGTLRRDLRPADVELLFQSVGNAVRSSCGVPGEPWRRYLEILFAGLRPGDPASV